MAGIVNRKLFDFFLPPFCYILERSDTALRNSGFDSAELVAGFGSQFTQP